MSSIEAGPRPEETSEIIDRVPTLEELYEMMGGSASPDDSEALENESPVLRSEVPQSRVARIFDGLSRGAQSFSEKLSTSADRQQWKFNAAQESKAQREAQDDAYDTYADNIEATEMREQQERADARQEKVDAAKSAIRRFGRSALTLPRRASIEARAQFAVGKEIAAEKYDALKNFFTERKAAALVRKEERQRAAQAKAEARAAEREKLREINTRTAEVRADQLRAGRVARRAAKIALQSTASTERTA